MILSDSSINHSLCCSGVPLPPGNLHLETSNGTTLIWSRPANIHKDMGVNYTVTVESSVSTRQFTVIERAHLSHNSLEQSLSNPGECEAFRFHVVAHVAGVNDSQPATLNDTLPHGEFMQLGAVMILSAIKARS